MLIFNLAINIIDVTYTNLELIPKIYIESIIKTRSKVWMALIKKAVIWFRENGYITQA